MTRIPSTRAWLLAPLVLVAACSTATPPAPPVDRPLPPREAGLAFVNQVWKVSESRDVALGMLYVFLSDGTLVMSAPGSRPALGTWAAQGEGLTMTEDGITYSVQVLESSPARFRLRSFNPGEPVDITLVPAAGSR